MNIQEVKKKLKDLQIKPLHSLGQNFLIDDNIVHKIYSAKNIDDYDYVIEIGPGLGSLTEVLKKYKDKLLLIELDRTLSSYWKDQGYAVENIDALKYLWSKVPKNSILISNLPYQISSRLIIELFTSYASVDSMVLMFQKEVGERILSGVEDKKSYGLISIICQLYWNPAFLIKVSKNCFYPSPEIESVVLTFDRKEPLKGEHKKFVEHLKRLFSARRKKISTTLRKRPELKEVKSKYMLDLRPDQLTPSEHLALFYELNSIRD